MPIFERDEKKVLFLHIPKTGGTSIEEWLSGEWEMSFHTVGKSISLRVTPQHFTYNDFIQLFAKKFWDYAFAIVRNPYDRIVSEYFYVTQWSLNNFGKRPNFSHWVVENLKKYTNDSAILDNHLRPQYEFVDEDVEIYRFEEGLENIMMKLSEKLDTAMPQTVPKRHVSKREEVSFSTEALEMVNRIYEKDFQYFDYDIRHKKFQIV